MHNNKTIVLVSLFLYSVTCWAQPSLINYQGRLLDTQGEPVNGAVTVLVRLYGSETGGAALWQQTNQVEAINGIYTFNFGNEQLSPALNASQIWLELVINGEVMTPRQRLVSGPYALWAERLADAGNIMAGTIHASRIPSLPASQINSGVFDAALIPGLDASKITSGTINTSRIPDLDAAKITSGILSADRLPALSAAQFQTGILAIARGGTGTNEATGTGKVVLNTNPSFSGTVLSPQYNFVRSDNSSGRLFHAGLAAPNQHMHFLADYMGQAGATDNSVIFGFNSDITSYSFFSRQGGVNRSLMRLDAGSGNIGIGTSEPAERLTVNGNIAFSSASIPMGIISEVGGTQPLLNFSVNFRGTNKNNSYRGGALRIDSRGGGQPLFQFLSRAANSSDEHVRMSITENGDVGIGTTIPAYKLDVQGNFRSVGGTIIAENTSEVGGNLALVNPQKTGATTRDWRIFNTTAGYGNGLMFWRYYANGVNAGPAMFIGDNGKVGIGTTGPEWTLDVNGNIRARNGARVMGLGGETRTDWPGGWGRGLETWDILAAGIACYSLVQQSDSRTKTDIISLSATNGIELISSLNPVSYRTTRPGPDPRLRYGFIAQEIEEIFPELVETGSDEEALKSINYISLIPILTQAIKDQQAVIEDLKVRLAAVEAR